MRLLSILILLFSTNSIVAVEYKKFDDPEKEQAYKVLVDELRCLVCQNQTIADSNADLAKDLRRQVYEMLQQGKLKDEIVDFMIQRYGDFVMYNPPFKVKTALLWIGPIIFLLIGLLILVVLSKRGKSTAESENESGLNAAEIAKIKNLLSHGEKS